MKKQQINSPSDTKEDMQVQIVRIIMFGALLLSSSLTWAQSTTADLVSDPIFPLINLPRDYEARRATTRKRLAPGESVELLDAKGPGAVRHFWITSGAPDGIWQLDSKLNGY